MGRLPWVAVVGLSASAGLGCTPQLGDAPFLCNPGTPKCPEGYICKSSGGQQICVRPSAVGKPRPKPSTDGGTSAGTDGSKRTDVGASGSDSQLPPWFDGGSSKLDQSVLPRDSTAPAGDSGGPRVGCKTNAECKQKDPANPCCCKVPLIPFVWDCFPLCLDPICF